MDGVSMIGRPWRLWSDARVFLGAILRQRVSLDKQTGMFGRKKLWQEGGTKAHAG